MWWRRRALIYARRLRSPSLSLRLTYPRSLLSPAHAPVVLSRFTIWEAGTRVPLMVRAPWLGAGGRDVAELAELVDVMPTIAELAGVPLDASYSVDGDSLVPALLRAAYAAGPSAAAAAATAAPPPNHLGEYAFSVYARCPADTTNSSKFWQNNDCLFVERSTIPFMGLSVRTASWRYSEYRHWLGGALAPDWTRPPVGVELYTHEGDAGNATTFDDFEVVNLAGLPEYAGVQAELAALLLSVAQGAGE